MIRNTFILSMVCVLSLSLPTNAADENVAPPIRTIRVFPAEKGGLANFRKKLQREGILLRADPQMTETVEKFKLSLPGGAVKASKDLIVVFSSTFWEGQLFFQNIAKNKDDDIPFDQITVTASRLIHKDKPTDHPNDVKKGERSKGLDPVFIKATGINGDDVKISPNKAVLHKPKHADQYGTSLSLIKIDKADIKEWTLFVAGTHFDKHPDDLTSIQDPVPAKGAKEIPDETTILQWKTSAQEGWIVDSYQVYLDTDALAVLEPNLPFEPLLISGDFIDATLLADPNCGEYEWSGPVDPDTTYHWRVEAFLFEPNQVELTQISSDVFNFSGVELIPALLGPLDQYVVPNPFTQQFDSEYPAEATFEVEVDSATQVPLAIDWFKDGVPLVNGGNISGADTAILTVTNAQTSDEGDYHSEIVLSWGSVFSNSAQLFVKDQFLRNRYSFDANFVDSVGGQDGSFVGVPEFSGDGRVIISNPEGMLSDDPSINYVDLPNGLMSSLGDVGTIMIWYTWDDPNRAFESKVFEFGESIEGEGLSGQRVNSVAFTPQGDDGFAVLRVGEGSGLELETINPTPIGHQQCIACVFADNQNQLYANGEILQVMDGVDLDLNTLTDVNNWLGRSLNGDDEAFRGSIDELRIYDVALSEPWVRDLCAAGPDIETVDPCVGPFQDPQGMLADLNFDCLVDLFDLVLFSQQFLSCGFLAPGGCE